MKTHYIALQSILLLSFALPCLAAPDANTANMERLLDAISYIESNNDSNAVGDGGKAVGAYQIWPIMVKEINRILGKNKYALKDRLNYTKSREMCRIYLLNCKKGLSLVDLGRCWNGGYNGYKKEATKKYGEKIKKYLEKRK